MAIRWRGTSTISAARSTTARAGRVALADGLAAGDHRREPVEEVQELAARDTGKQILVPAREADDLVRKHRSDDQDQVVFEDGAVDGDVDRLREQAPGELGDLTFLEAADPDQRIVQVPAVVQEPGTGEVALPVGGGDAEEVENALLAHHGVRAQRHHVVEPCRA